MHSGQKRQTSLSVTDSNLPSRRRLYYDLRQGHTLDAPITRYGSPQHKVSQADFEIWQYPLGLGRP